MLLKEKLNTLQNEKKLCAFSRICISLDQETRDSLIGVMANQDVPTRSIVAVLRGEGFSIGRSSIDQARKCLKGLNPECHKCIQEAK